jgi:hypothetical protein
MIQIQCLKRRQDGRNARFVGISYIYLIRVRFAGLLVKKGRLLGKEEMLFFD